MAFIDHDLHIHSFISPCAGAEAHTQIPESILHSAEIDGLSTICITDHFWDDSVPFATDCAEWARKQYAQQNLMRIRSVHPLPQGEHVRFLLGCEAEMDVYNTIGLHPEHYDLFDFIVIAINHLHLEGFSCRGKESSLERADLWTKRFECVLDQDLPFYKIGLAHLTDTPDVLPHISDETFHSLFRKATEKGVGIELNYWWLGLSDEQMELHLRPYRIAKEVGCKFYLGSDAHVLSDFESRMANFTKITNCLELDDSHKFII